MSSVAQHPSTVEYLETLRLSLQHDCALRQAAIQARARYAGEAKRIDKALVIALNGGVTLSPNGTAAVQSASDPEIVYHVCAGVCDCPDFARAPDGRCKHRFAACIVKRAQKAMAREQALQAIAADVTRFAATYTDPDGSIVQGIATATAHHGWLFCPGDGGKPVHAAVEALVFGGNCAIAEAQRAEEEARGGLVAIICGYGK